MLGIGVGVTKLPVYSKRGGATGFWASGFNRFYNQSAYNSYSAGTKTLDTSGTNISDSGGINGTYFNNSGVLTQKTSGTAPRITYNVSGVLTGLYIEPATTNIAWSSLAIDDTTWSATVGSPFTVVADNTTWLSGATVADKCSPSAGNPYRRQLVNATNGSVYSASAYVKAPASGAATNGRITTNNTISWNTGFSSVVAINTSAWQRLSGSWTQSGGTQAYLILGAPDVSGANDTTTYGDIFFAGTQIENNPFTTSYIPTAVGSSTTRSVDQPNYTDSVLTNAAGTILVSFVPYNPSSATKQIIVQRGDAQIYIQSSAVKVFDGTNTVTLGNATANTSNTVAASWSGGTLAASLNGAAAVSGSFDGAFGAVSTLNLGQNGTGGTPLCGYLTRLAGSATAANTSQLASASGGTL